MGKLVVVKLADIAEVRAGQSPPGPTISEAKSGVPFFQGAKDFGPRYPRVRTYTTAPARLAQPGDILLSVRAPIGRVNRSQTECAIGRGLVALRGLFGKVCTDYLEYWLRFYEPRWHQHESAGSVFANLSTADLRRLEIPLPPLSEQRAIAEVLGALDDKIEANRRVRQILMELLDLSYIASVEACAEQSVPMGELVELGLGGVWGSDEPQSPDDIRVNCLRGIDLANVANGVRPLPPVRWLSRTQFEKREYTEGEIWVEGSGSFCGRSLLVGHYLDNLFEGPIRPSNFVKRLVPRQSSSLATVAWLSLRYAYRSGEISAWRTGSAFPNINVEALLRHVVKVPPSAVVDDLAVLAKVVLDPAPLLESVRLASLRDALLPKLLSGELRVRDAERLVEDAV
jgi:type I restriction enzyme S subunit